MFVGNVMIDSLLSARARPTDALARLGLHPACMRLRHCTVPRTSTPLRPWARHSPRSRPLRASSPSCSHPPRTVERVRELGFEERLQAIDGLSTIPPLGYLDFATSFSGACLVATDSGGIQEETTALGIPCLTLRQGTEPPITVTSGTNTVVGLDRARIALEVDAVIAGKGKRGSVPEGWDGSAGERCATAILALATGTPPPRTAGPRA